MCYNKGRVQESLPRLGLAAYASVAPGGFLLPVFALLNGFDGIIERFSIAQNLKDFKPFGLEQGIDEHLQLLRRHAGVLLHLLPPPAMVCPGRLSGLRACRGPLPLRRSHDTAAMRKPSNAQIQIFGGCDISDCRAYNL